MVDTHKQEPEETDFIPEEIEAGDEPDIEDIEAQSTEKMKKLRDSLKASEAEKMKALEDLQRARADFLNSKRRLEEQLARDRERIIERMIIDLLPLVDSFEAAQANKELWEKIDPIQRTGIEGIYAQLMSYLKSNNVEVIETLGKHFSPHEHEAVANVPVTDEAQRDTVIAVLQKGFKRNDVIIRPAKVAVGTHE